MAPDKLSEAGKWCPKVLEDLKYNPDVEFATFAKVAGELGI